MKKVFTSIILLVLSLSIPPTSMAQKAHKLMKPNRTQTEQLTSITPVKESIVLKTPNRGLRTIDSSVFSGVMLLLMKCGAITLSNLKTLLERLVLPN